MSGYRFVALPRDGLMVLDGQAWTAKMFLVWLVERDVRLNDSVAGARTQARILKDLESESWLLRLTAEDWERLKSIVEKPMINVMGQVQAVYPATPAFRWLPAIEAVISASTEPPALEAPKAPESEAA